MIRAEHRQAAEVATAHDQAYIAARPGITGYQRPAIAHEFCGDRPDGLCYVLDGYVDVAVFEDLGVGARLPIGQLIPLTDRTPDGLQRPRVH